MKVCSIKEMAMKDIAMSKCNCGGASNCNCGSGSVCAHKCANGKNLKVKDAIKKVYKN